MRLRNIFGFSQWVFVITKLAQGKFCIWLNKKKPKSWPRAWHTMGRLGGAHTIRVIGSVVVSSSYWCDACHWWWSSLAPIGLFFSLLLLSLLPKKLPSTWVVSMPFSVLFHLERHVIAYSGRIIVDGCLIPPPRFSLRTGNVHHCPLCFLLFNFNPHFINFLFRFFSIYTSFILFNLVLQL